MVEWPLVKGEFYCLGSTFCRGVLGLAGRWGGHPDKLELTGLEIEVGRSFHPLDARCYRFTDPATGGCVV